MSLSQSHTFHATRLDGLDIARFLAFVGMVIVNFRIVFSGDSDHDFSTLGQLLSLLEGRAAATFVVLAGIGLGLAGMRATPEQSTFATAIVPLKRSVFLMVLGLLNMLIFDADILHYYAVYFFFGALLLSLAHRLSDHSHHQPEYPQPVTDPHTGLQYRLELCRPQLYGFLDSGRLRPQPVLSMAGIRSRPGWDTYSSALFSAAASCSSNSTQWWLIAAGTVAVAGAEFTSTLLTPFIKQY